MNYSILNKIKSPDDLKELSIDELNHLSEEVRDLIIKTVSKTGGHLASSLGAVESTIALYRVFNPPKDKIIWDVGHQAYAHKILTGRARKFKTLRQLNGISGFLKIKESKYDIFGAGHSSTSISAAFGFAKARDMKKEKNYIVSVIGDASLANGMALEAINNIGHDKTDLLIYVIDNEMSISPTVGALSEYLNKIITGNFYNRLRDITKAILNKIPKFGVPFGSIIKHFEEGVKGIFSPGIIFEELGFKFFGPINGHNIKLIIDTLEKIKDIKGPKLLHVYTKKGKGYLPAEKNPTLFHGVGPFDVETGKPIKTDSSLTYSKVFSDILIKEAKWNKKLVAIVAAMVEGTNLSEFKEKFLDRFFDVGIAEEHAVTFAGGLAADGYKPFVCIYSTFFQRSIDQIIHDICLQDLPVVFSMDRAGLVGEDGATHHGIFDIVFMKMIPNIVVMAPSDGNELRRAVITASRYKRGPISIRFPRGKAYFYKGEDKLLLPFVIGKGRLLKKGEDLTIVNLGHLLKNVLNAVMEIEKNKKISIEIIDARFAKPLDKNLILKSIIKTGKVITVEEGILEGGFGHSVNAIIKNAGVKNIKIINLGISDKFIEHGTVEELRAICGLDEKGIIKAIENILK